MPTARPREGFFTKRTGARKRHSWRIFRKPRGATPNGVRSTSRCRAVRFTCTRNSLVTRASVMRKKSPRCAPFPRNSTRRFANPTRNSRADLGLPTSAATSFSTVRSEAARRRCASVTRTPTPPGALRFSDDELLAYYAQAEALGIAAGVHAIGDAAIEQSLRVWERAARRQAVGARVPSLHRALRTRDARTHRRLRPHGHLPLDAAAVRRRLGGARRHVRKAPGRAPQAFDECVCAHRSGRSDDLRRRRQPRLRPQPAGGYASLRRASRDRRAAVARPRVGDVHDQRRALRLCGVSNRRIWRPVWHRISSCSTAIRSKTARSLPAAGCWKRGRTACAFGRSKVGERALFRLCGSSGKCSWHLSENRLPDKGQAVLQ